MPSTTFFFFHTYFSVSVQHASESPGGLLSHVGPSSRVRIQLVWHEIEKFEFLTNSQVSLWFEHLGNHSLLLSACSQKSCLCAGNWETVSAAGSWGPVPGEASAMHDIWVEYKPYIGPRASKNFGGLEMPFRGSEVQAEAWKMS